MSIWSPGAGVVQLPDGRRVRGTGLRRPRDEVPPPEFAVYLLKREPEVGDWPCRWVRWRDFGLPASTEEALEVLREAHDRAVSERVEIACAGGVGRTGTALAVLAVIGGVDAEQAVAWVREHYHPGAVETRRQRRWVTETMGAEPGP